MRPLMAAAGIFQADVTAPGELQAAVERFEREAGGPIDGIFHLAAVGDVRRQWAALASQDAVPDIQEALASAEGAKIAGTIACVDVVAERDSARLVIFSSVVGHTGRGEAAYAVSNAAQQAIFENLPLNVAERATCLEWSMWRDIGMSQHSPPAAVAAARASGFRVLDVSTAMGALRGALTIGWGRRLMFGLDPEALTLQSDIADPRTSRLRVLVAGVPDEALESARNMAAVPELAIPVELHSVAVLPDKALTESALAGLLRETGDNLAQPVGGPS